MNSPATYSNPFSQYNANLMTEDEILSYWCSPFFGLRASGVDEKQVFTDAQPIVFEGGRGTGKTMFLRYFSHEVQLHDLERRAEFRGDSLARAIENGGVGIYIRMDGALVRDFIGKGVDADVWEAVFGHYFDLYVCERYVDLVRAWCSDGAVKASEVATFVDSLCGQLGAPSDPRTLDHASAVVEARINEVRDFRAAVSFDDVSFTPSKAVAAGDLTFGIPKALSDAIPKLPRQFRFLVLLDEYENFSECQQRILNTLLKFPRENVTFRVGMRLEGFHTADTISPDEFIKVGRDYTAVVFEDILAKDAKYREFLRDVARRRLEAQPYFKQRGWVDIRQFLGASEDVELEARSLVGKRKGPTRYLERAVAPLASAERSDALASLSRPENPLMEMLNAVWLLRGRSVTDTRHGMRDYVAERDTELEKKYRRDLVDKYKLSLMFLLASHEKRDKLYYSFNTYCFLSSGIVGNFLELCRRAFQVAAFEDRTALLERGEISATLQSRAAREVGRSELDMIRRIPQYGTKLAHFANSLGNGFRTYHLDAQLRYPETNQFSVDLATVPSEADGAAFKAAIRWSVIQRKPRLQRASPGSGKTENYTLNRILASVFQISYRTRGGKSATLRGDRLPACFSSDEVPAGFGVPIVKGETGTSRAGSLFSWDDED